MEIRSLKGDDAATAAALLPAFRATCTAAFPGMPAPSEQALQWELHTFHGHESQLFGAFETSDAVVAGGFLKLGLGITENPDLATAQICVAPELRGAGIGSALLDLASFASRERDRRRIIVSAPISAAFTGFAIRNGGRATGEEVRSVLDLGGLTTADRDAYAAMAAPSPANAEYRLVRWIDHCPEELLESYNRTLQDLDDAPTGDLAYDMPTFTAELMRAWEAESVAFGKTRYVVAALADGEVVGVSSLLTTARDEPVGDIAATSVARAHRGHGLGVRIKADAVLWLRDVAPHLTLIQTWNDAGNSHMLAVNRALGYAARETWRTYEFDLTGG